jgi:hypothetical protein
VRDRERETTVRDALRSERAPEEAETEERAWRLIQAAQREQRGELRPGRASRWRSPALRIAVALGLLAVLVSPAGAEVRDWVKDTVNPGHEPARPALTALPAPGTVLVQSSEGPWVVQEDGSKRLLGDYSAATWSPRGLFVAAASGRQLVALDPAGEVRWTLARSGRISDPSWNTPDGFRIAYLSGDDLRVVAGDGTGDQLLAPRVGRVAPAWMPGPRYVLAFSAPSGRVEAVEADSGKKVFATQPGPKPIGLQWTADGTRLMVVSRSGVEFLDARGRPVRAVRAPKGTIVRQAQLSPDGRRVAITVTTGLGAARSRLLLVGSGKGQRSLFSGPGRFDGLAWSPNGRWILLGWRSADQWLFLNPRRPNRIVAISNIASQFSPGETPRGSLTFPGIGGWCCSQSRGPAS